MDRVRYECRISVGGDMPTFYCNDTDAILTMVAMVCRGAQVRDSIRLTVVDTASRGCPRSSLGAETCLGFTEATETFLNALNQRQSRPVRPEEGRDVVVEVHFAAHNATLDDCREFASRALDLAFADEQKAESEGELRHGEFSCNGSGVGDVWFE